MSKTNNIAAAGYPSHRFSQNTNETPTSRHQYQMQSDIFESERDPTHSKVNPVQHLNMEGITFQNTKNECVDGKDDLVFLQRPAAGFASYQIPSNTKPASTSRHHYVMSSDLIGKEMDVSENRRTTGAGSIEQFSAHHLNMSSQIDEVQVGSLAEGGENSEEQVFNPGK